MKTRFFAAFVAAMMAITTVSASNNSKKNEAYSPDILPGVTVVATAKQKTLEVRGTNNVMKYEYNLDDLGRVSSKVAYVQGKKNSWIPVSAYSVFYGMEETVLTYAEYNNNNHVFNHNAQQRIYMSSEYPEIIKLPQILK